MTTSTTTQPADLRRATPDDLPEIERLLSACGLPSTGVREVLTGFVVAHHDGKVIGVIGLERYQHGGLLRSTAVASEWRDRGIGRRLVERIIAEAELEGVRALYLLTNTAERYFPRFGFAAIARETVPPELRQAEEFRSVCCATAVVMSRPLGSGPAASR